MMLDGAAIARLVPHAGAMCLLAGVREWAAGHIVCTADGMWGTHALARDGELPSIAACEYAAQAAAVHGALLEGTQVARAGMLAKLMDVQLHATAFSMGQAITVRAELMSRAANGCMYAFDVEGAGKPVASGRLIVAYKEAAG